jgi:hypothetical protein
LRAPASYYGVREVLALSKKGSRRQCAAAKELTPGPSPVATLYKTPTKQLIRSPVTPAAVDYAFGGVDGLCHHG